MKSKKNVWLMCAIALLQGMVFYGPVATLYRQANGITVFQITLIESISYLLCIAFEVPWGIIADKIGYKKTMSFCCIIYLVSKIAFWRSSGFCGFLLERILLSVVISGLSGVDTSILYLSCNEGGSQKTFSIYNSLGLLGLLVSSFIFSAFVGANYSVAALLTVGSYGIAMLLSFFLDEVKSVEDQVVCLPDLRLLLSRIIKDRKFISFLISVAFLSQTHQTITVFLNQIQYEKCGMSNSTIGYVYIIVTLCGLVGVFSAKLTLKIGDKRIGIAFYFAAIVSCVILAFAHTALVSVLGVLLLNMINSLYQPYQMELQNKHVLSANRATELSVYAMIVNCVSAGTSTLFGAIANINLETAFFFGAAICLVGLISFPAVFTK